MERKNGPYRARLRVCKAMSDPRAAAVLEELARKKPQVFVQSVNTAYLAAQLSEVYKYAGDADELVMAALMHDSGMLEVPDSILQKAGRLSPGERAVVRHHVADGVCLLRERGFTGTVLDAAKEHHERSDGSGYMEGLTSPDIPRPVKIVLACDVYEAMTADRPQRKAFNMYEAIAMMSSMPLSQAVLQSIKRCTDT